jgi:hypothetical protein
VQKARKAGRARNLANVGPLRSLDSRGRLSLHFSRAGDSFAGFFVGGAAALGFAFVPLLLAAS